MKTKAFGWLDEGDEPDEDELLEMAGIEVII